MSRTIDYLFTLLSPWAYLGFDQFHALAWKHGATIRYRPVLLGEVFAQTGGLPLAQRPPARQAYRFSELQRWRARRGVPLKLRPSCFPFDAATADCITLALIANGHSPEGYLRRAHRAVWAEERDLSDETELRAVLKAENLPEDALEAARSDGVRADYVANRDWAIETGIFGAPSYVLDGEIFWGQDRLELLDDALTSRRKPYLPHTDH